MLTCQIALMDRIASTSFSDACSSAQNPSFTQIEVPPLSCPETPDEPEHELWSKLDCVDFIVQNLWDDKPSVKQCSAVSHVFREACTPRMYSFLDICLEMDQIPRLQILYRLMSEDKEVARKLQYLSLSSKLHSCSLDQQNLDFLNSFLLFFLNQLLLVEREAQVTREHIAASSGGNHTDTSLPGLRALKIVRLQWHSLKIEAQILFFDLISSLSQLHTVVLPVCDDWYCLRKSTFFLDMFSVVNSLQHLYLESTHLFCHDLTLGSEPIHGNCTGKKIEIRSLNIVNFNDYLTEYLFYFGCPYDFSYLQEICFGGLQNNFQGQAMKIVTRHSHQTLRSLIWLIGPDRQNWESNFDLLFESDVNSELLPEVAPLAGLVEIHLQHLTLSVEKISSKFGIDSAFEVLFVQLGIRPKKIEVLNLAYPIEVQTDLSDFVSSIELALARADMEFHYLCALHKFPALQTINLFLTLSDTHLAKLKLFGTCCLNLKRTELKYFPSTFRFQSSNYCSLAKEYAPNMHGTGKLYLMATSMVEGWRGFIDRASIKNNLKGMSS